MKEYTDFKEFYNDVLNLVEDIKTKNLNQAEQISFARKYILKDTLNNYTKIGILPNNILDILNCSSNILKFSVDNLIKNILTHPEVLFDDYVKIPKIIKDPSKYYKIKSGYDVILFKEDEKYYKLVIKTTKNRKENFVKSLHLLNKERYNKY